MVWRFADGIVRELMKHYLWHRFIYYILRVAAGPLVKYVMGYSCSKQKGPDEPSLILANHNTDLDPALVALGFTRHMYFLSSEHAFRRGFPSKVLRFLFAPIPFTKTKTDVAASKEMIRKLHAGANVCLFPEGDRSFYGTTGQITLSTAKLAKISGAGLITFRLEGGYFTAPRWSKKLRKGRMSGAIAGRYSAAELKSMTDKQVLDVIERDLYESAYERQKVKTESYRGKKLAENIETALYLCPGCKKIGTIRSEGKRFSCLCGLSAEYTETGLLVGETLPFSTLTEWGRWQVGPLAEIIDGAGDAPICSDDNQQLFGVEAAMEKIFIAKGKMYIDREAFHCAGMSFPLQQITKFAIVGQMTLLFSTKDGATFEVRSKTPRSAIKYREIFCILTG